MSPAPALSVIVPTWNRSDVLPEVLDALEAQEGAPDFEVVVVDDGSTDATPQLLEDWRPRVPMTVLRQENRGPAAARNLGVRTAVASRVAFLGDDTVPEKRWLAAHHRAGNKAVEERWLATVGYTGWHPRIRRTPFLDWINEYGLQFGYSLIEDPERVPFNFFYTSNLCLPREALLEEPFDERFPYPAWEDIETAYRLQKQGLRIVYASDARTAHDHPTDLDRFMARQEKAGYSGVVFSCLHPEMGGFVGVGEGGPPPEPPAWKRLPLEILARRLQVRWKTPRLWNEVLRFHYIRGLHRGWLERDRWRKELRHDPT